MFRSFDVFLVMLFLSQNEQQENLEAEAHFSPGY